MGIGAQRINLAAMLASSRVIALAEVRGTAPVPAELELVREVAVLEPAAARARVIVRVLVLVIALAEVRELETGPVEAELEPQTGPVAEPEIAQVEAVLVRSQPRAQLAVPLRIKSVTGPRRHDQVLLLTVEDLVVEVVETTHGQAAAEAAIAWAAAE
jgi:hypothetical protein